MNLNEINKHIDSFCIKLGRENAVNYQCEMKVYSGEWVNKEKEEKILKIIMTNNFIVRNLEASDLNRVLSTFETAARYTGNDGAHPNTNFIQSSKFEGELKVLLRNIKLLFEGSKVTQFYIREGHPFYPVFWDFAFLLKKNNKAYVFIGSSSD